MNIFNWFKKPELEPEPVRIKGKFLRYDSHVIMQEKLHYSEQDKKVYILKNFLAHKIYEVKIPDSLPFILELDDCELHYDRYISPQSNQILSPYPYIIAQNTIYEIGCIDEVRNA